MTEPATWRPDAQEVPEFDPAALKESWDKRRAEERKAIQAARDYYHGCGRLEKGHPYLDSHGLDMTGCHGLRVDKDGWLVIPARRNYDIVSLQRIAPDGTKRFWPGAPISGTAYRIERRSSAVTILCEGFATGLALYAAVPHSRVIVAWSTGNLSKIEAVPKGMCVVAADNDHGTEERTGTNPGIQAAQEAAEALSVGVAYPEGVQGTDWADYRQERLAEAKMRARQWDTEAGLLTKVDREIARQVLAAARFRV